MKRTFKILAAAAATIALLVAPALARAEAPIPTPGPWSGVTSVGLPVHFTVEGTDVSAARFGFHWGFCGDFEGESTGPAAIDPEGNWKLVDTRGAAIEGAVVAADRIEGAVTSVSRELPGCPATHATFVAIPGEVPPPSPPQYYTVMNTGSGFQLRSPEYIVLGRHNSFTVYDLKWSGWGHSVARGSGHAQIDHLKQTYMPRATITLSRPIADGPAKRLYSYLRLTLKGPVPPGHPHQGWFKFDRHGLVAASDGPWPGGHRRVRHPHHK